MSWTEMAEKVTNVTADHEWFRIFHAALQVADPGLYANLERQGEVEAYCHYTISEGLGELEELMDRGATFEQAQELVFDGMVPKAAEPVAEDWEIDRTEEDEAAEFSTGSTGYKWCKG